MIRTLIISFTLLALSATAQKDPNEQVIPIVEEGKLLYRSEMASWYGTDLFLASYKTQENIGGYFSYLENDLAKCVFFSKSENPVVIGTISFDSSYDPEKAKTDLTERAFSKTEEDLYTVRKIALNEIRSDTLFKVYKNTNLNLIPLINGKERKVYVLTGPQQNGVVIFGNDYLLTFDNNNKLLVKKQLHKNIIPIYYGQEKEGEKAETAMHSHLPETGEFMTATDICTLMLYEKYAQWKSHVVVSEKYMNTWNCETNELVVIPMETVEKINEDQKKRNKDRKKSEN